MNWALDGQGILLRAEWDVARYIKSRRLVHILGNYHTPDAYIYAVYSQRHKASTRVSSLIDFVIGALSKT